MADSPSHFKSLAAYSTDIYEFQMELIISNYRVDEHQSSRDVDHKNPAISTPLTPARLSLSKPTDKLLRIVQHWVYIGTI